MNAKHKMSTETMSTSSISDRSESQSGTEEAMDKVAYVSSLTKDERINVCYHLDQNNAWEKAARKMGYTLNDIIVSVCSSHMRSLCH